MNAIVLPKDLEAWAQAEVAAGHAESLNALAAKAVALLRREQQLAQVRDSLGQAVAEADRDGWLDADEAFANLIGGLETKCATG